MSAIQVPPQQVLNELGTALSNAVRYLKQLNQSVDVRPFIRQQLDFSDIGQSEYRFRLKPTVFRVLERPDKSQPHLYVVLKGDVCLDLSARSRFVTFFVSEVGYFLYSPASRELEGKFAAHYDFERSAINHPVFHAQLTAIDEASRDLVVDQFRIRMDKYIDHTRNLFRQVRVPTAQLDFLAVLTQIGADHLLRQDAVGADIEAFNELRDSCSQLPGAAGGMGRFADAHFNGCVRGPHWYPPD